MAGDAVRIPARRAGAVGSDHRGGQASVLGVRGLCGEHVDDVSFSLRGGEILGLTGLSGAGHEQVVELLFGAERARAGEITVKGRSVRPSSPRAALDAGLAFLAPDRRRRGAVGGATIRENLTIPFVGRFTRAGHLRHGKERDLVMSRITALRVAGGSSETPIGLLSGGNQQKVLLGRWLEFDPVVYLLSNPTEGVDIGTRAALYEILRDLAKQGRGVLVSTGDLEELAALCDRVLVFADGRLAGELAGEGITRETLVRAVEQFDGEVLAPASAAPEQSP
jgi:ABC-type sugar transport system ATPase subunit